MNKYAELDKLEQLLKQSGAQYERIDQILGKFCDKEINRHQIIVFDESGEIAWDAICHYGSYGYDEGLLEVMGPFPIAQDSEDDVEGYLTAEEVFKRYCKSIDEEGEWKKL